MSILSKIRSWTTEIGEFYASRLYREDNFPLFWLVKKVLSKVELTDEFVEELHTLSHSGIVVYALKHKSQLNSLILRELSARKGIPRPVYCHGINMLFWQPFPMAVRVVLSFLVHLIFKRNVLDACKTGYFKRLITERKSVVVHLGDSEYFENRDTQEAITQLIETQKNLEVPIHVVPVMVTYGRRREIEKESIVNILFGQTEDTDALGRVITFLRYSHMATVIPADSVNLREFVAQNGTIPPETMYRDLRRELIDRIDEERTSIVGPVLKSRKEMISMVLGDRGINEFIDNMVARGIKDRESLVKEANKYVREIAADYSETLIELWERFLTWLWNNIYDGVVIDKPGLAKIRNISKRMPFVIIPCHRSHIDYLLLSYVFYKNNIQMPFVAAGTNLLFWPLGYLFRKSGAFFIRRTFRGNILYGEIFAKYLEVLLKEGLPLEFFIEGGRSRSGKMVMPKYGLLSMLIQAYQKKACEDLAAIPVYIGYDRVIEEESYLREIGGVPKKKETTSDVIRSRRFLRKRYGRVYVNVGEPIFLKSYLTAQEIPFEEMTTEERQSFYRKIGYEIALEINKVSVVTPFSLVASGLLSHDRRGISHDELIGVLRNFHEYLSCRKVNLAATLVNMDRAVGEALYLFEQAGIISKIGVDENERDEIEEIVYSLDDDKRLKLEYYKNNILHYFLPVSFVSASLLSSHEDTVAIDRILRDYQFLKRLFWHEFIFDDRTEDVGEVKEVLSYLHSKGMIKGIESNGQTLVEVRGKGRRSLMPFVGLIHNYFESYWVVIRGCRYLRKEPKQEKEWLKKIQQLGVKMHKKGEIRRAEALSQSNYQNAMRFLEDEEIVIFSEDVEKGDRKEVVTYTFSGNKEKMDSLRRRLFRFL
ncbi:MAG: hypothetical protein FJ139_07055 [Deltaproteobacteria bacterium]|nr:hypothetical protein [Deltaproteobacteria bacterium]